MTEYPENSLDSLKTIFANSDLLECCDGFEFDICFTKDHIPVVLHDKYIDDVSEKSGFVSDYTLDELRRINFGFRKSKGLNNSQFSYRIITLDELLNFFLSHYDVVKDREIKIETKDYRFISRQNFSIKNFVVLADLIHKYHMLNITHLSFWPFNLITLRKIEIKRGYNPTPADYLCDLRIALKFLNFMPFLKRVSLRIKEQSLGEISSTNSKKVNRKIEQDNYWMNKSDVINEKIIAYIILKYGNVGFYTLNDMSNIEEFVKHISFDFFEDNMEHMTFTSNNPYHLRKL